MDLFQEGTSNISKGRDTKSAAVQEKQKKRTSRNTRFRKKKLVRKKLGSLSQCMALKDAEVLLDEDKTANQDIVPSKLLENLAVENPPKCNKYKTASSVKNNKNVQGIVENKLADDRSSSRKLTIRKSRKMTCVVQSMFLLHYYILWHSESGRTLEDEMNAISKMHSCDCVMQVATR